MVYLYRANAGLLRTVWKCSNTVVPVTLQKPEFWMFMFVHVAIMCAHRTGYLQTEGEGQTFWRIDWEGVHIVTIMTTFFEIFYTDRCYWRYMELYDHTRSLLGYLHEIIFEMRLHFGENCQQHTRLASRYIMASMILFFFEMDEEVADPEWLQLRTLELIKDEERVYLEYMSNDEMSTIVLHWCALVTRSGWKKSGAPATAMKSLMKKFHKLHKLQGTLLDIHQLPVPFQYFHLLNVMVSVNLFLWAYGLAVTRSVYSPLVFFFAQLIFMGMMELASELANPYGDDEVDFPVNHWLSQCIGTGMTLVEYRFPGSANDWDRALAKQERLGKNFPQTLKSLDLFPDGEVDLADTEQLEASDPKHSPRLFVAKHVVQATGRRDNVHRPLHHSCSPDEDPTPSGLCRWCWPRRTGVGDASSTRALAVEHRTGGLTPRTGK